MDPSNEVAADGDAGLFGPDSVTWRVHADPLMGVAGMRAQLLQALHPVVIEALDQHSAFRDDPWGRVARTAEYIGVTTFGTASQAMLAGSRVRAVHARIVGLTTTGVEYRADDPQLLAWVHCCLVASFLELVTRGGLRLTGADQDRYIAEQVRSAMLVGLEPDEVPHDRTGLLDYFRVIRPALDCSTAARRAARVVVAPQPALSGGARSAHAATTPLAGLAFATLPPWARRLYALTELPGPAGLPDGDATLALRDLRDSYQGTPCVPGVKPGVSGTGARPAPR